MTTGLIARCRGRLLACALLTAACVAWVPGSVALAQQAETPDALGLTPTQWLYLTGPDLRNSLGMPGSTMRVLAGARNGNPNAMAAMSGAYAAGSGVPVNSAESLRWARASSAAGLGLGHFVLALKYFYGDGVAKDTNQYIALLRRGVEAGHLHSAYELGGIYFKGQLVPKNLAEAARLAEISAKGGDPLGQFLYGALHYVREGPLFGTSGKSWFQAAGANGHQLAAEYGQALDLQERISELAPRLFVASFGNGLLGAETEALLPEAPCQSRLSVSKRDTTGSFIVDWTQTKAALMNPTVIHLNGAIQMRGGETKGRLVITLFQDQVAVEEDLDRIFILSNLAGRLSDVCHRSV